jgi:two-component system nitrogen regulation response regulator NtrX
VKVRVIAATNRDLTEMIRQGKFREDLFYRLNVIPLKTPALAEHPEDVPALVLHFAESFARTNNYRPKRFTDDALMALAARPWPGNVRELKNHVERLMIMTDGDVVDSVDVEVPGEARAEGPVVVRGGRVVREGETETAPEGSLPEPSLATASGATVPNEAWTRLLAVKTLQDFQDEAEKLYIVAKLAENGGNVTRTAEAVETPRSNLYKKMDRYGLKKREEGTA